NKENVLNKEKEQHIRYKNIAVAVSDPEGYRELIKRSFYDAGIPFFIDDTSSGMGNVSIELVRSALAVINNGYAYDDVLRYAKNALSINMGADDEIYHNNIHQADIFDNYIRAKGIRGRKAYEKMWNNTYRGAEGINLVELNIYKENLMRPVFILQDKMSMVSLISERIVFLKEFIQEIDLDERNRVFSEFLYNLDYIREAKENEEFYEMLHSLLDSISNLLGNEEMSLEEFTEIFEAGAADLKAGMVPQTLDAVIVGDLKRSRFDDIDILYIVGANEGYLPQIVSGGGIFTDQERELLREVQIELAPIDREDISIQNYYIYLLMNKPLMKIIMSYSYSDREGTGLKPSSVIKELKAKNEISEYSELSDEDMIYSKSEALLYFSELTHETEADNRRLSMYAYLKEDRETLKRSKMILDASAYNHDEDKISKEDAMMLYGSKLYGSVTRIEAYEKCAYAHFLRYGLRLLERQQFDIEAFDIGNLYHQAIELVFSELGKADKLIQSVSEDELSKLSENAVDRVIEEYNDQIMQSSARNVYISRIVKKITARTLWAIREQLVKGDFITLGCEIPFSIKEENLELRGRIDRVDISEKDSKIFVKVIDYKSGRTSFDLSLVYQGIQLQLVTYMDISIREAERRSKGDNKTAVPGGMFYYRVTNPIIDIEDYFKEKPMEELMLEKFMPDGLVNNAAEAIEAFDKAPGKTTVNLIGKKGATEETFSYLMKHTGKIIKEDADKILNGDINIRPYMTNDRTGCDYCKYHSICGFDDRMEGFKYRQIYKIDELEILSRLKKEYGAEETSMTERQDTENEMD
ncbi:MAG: PD-(D/E)XK nuclease family protein, partial [Eubacteriales bacterium]|nr:PD-(D/E)XK nuclease family protein [Eubacteriales bacterium]